MAVPDELTIVAENTGVGDAIGVHGGATAGHDGILDAWFFDDRENVFLAAVLALEADDDDALFFVALGQFRHLWEAGDARAAIDAPFFKDDDLSFERVLVELDTVDDFTPADVAHADVVYGCGFFLFFGKSREGEESEDDG